MRLFSTLILTLLVVALALPASATTPYHSTNGIWEENLNCVFDIIEVGNGDTLYAVCTGPPRLLKRSLDDGATWTTVKTFTRGGGFRSLFVDSKGRVYVGLSGTGKVHRGLVSGDSLAFTDVLTMQCATGAGSWWYMAEAAAGSLFVGNYAGTVDEHCAAIYRSSTGAHWSEVYYTAHLNRHIHVVGVDPWSDEVYASIGDTPVTDARIVHSANYGATWDTVRVGDVRCKPVSIAFSPTRRIWGSDVGTASSDSTNMIEWTSDDSAYTAALRLTGDEDNYIWAMGATDQRTIFAGTTGKRASGNDIRMYASWDSGGSWYTVKEFECTGNWQGMGWISRKADNDGFSYYCVTPAGGSGFDSYRFTGAAVWTIGSGGDFATIAAALADWRVGPHDTLELLAGTHSANGDALLEGMTLRGATQDAPLYIVKNGSRTESAITVNVPGVTVQDITFRDLGGYFTTSCKAMLLADDGADVTVTRCEFMSLRGPSAPGFYASGDGAAGTTLDVTLTDCRAESCSATSGDGGAIYIYGSDTIMIDGLVAVDNYSSADGGAIRMSNNTAQTTIKNSLFVNNRSASEGAAIYVKTLNSGDVKIWHCTFDGNECGTPANGQLWMGQTTPTNVLSHCIIANGDTTYAVKNGTAYIDSVRHVDSWNNGEDHIFGTAAVAYTDTIHIDPEFNCLNVTTDCYRGNAPDVETCADGSFMGWLRGVQGRGRPIALSTTGRYRGRRGRR
ncbi:hypothetical protein KAW64_01990 [bacterium]|nr:hypothetical protein [bacterium]